MKYSEWNDTGIPLAHLITFRCYGTWLHGDERGSVDRFHRIYGTPCSEKNENWKTHNLASLKGDPVNLGAKRRKAVYSAIVESCRYREWR